MEQNNKNYEDAKRKVIEFCQQMTPPVVTEQTRMSITEFVTNCTREGLEYSLAYFECMDDEYCLQIILSNQEWVIPVWDEEKLCDLWYHEIVRYWRPELRTDLSLS